MYNGLIEPTLKRRVRSGMSITESKHKELRFCDI